MITKLDHSTSSTNKVVETFIAGTVNLTPIEYYHMPDEVLAKAGIYLNDDMPLDYSARIVWDTQEVIVTIGDYIIARWNMCKLGSLNFTNDKGYGDMHVQSYIEQLPVGIVSDVMGCLWPKM